MLVPRLHPQSIMSRSPNDGLYSNLYDKDMSLMRKLMNLDEFQNVGSNASNSDASKQFHSYTNGVFNGKMLSNSTATNFAFPYEKHQQQQPQQHHMNGLLKPCYDFSSVPTKSEPLDEGNFNSGFATKKSSQAPLFGTGNSGGGSGGFMNQFSHHHDYGSPANSHHQAFATKLNEINNNNTNSSGGGIVVKLENGGNDYNNALRTAVTTNTGASTMVVNKTEPNEFRNSCKDNEDDERKVSLHPHDNESNDGFTQL